MNRLALALALARGEMSPEQGDAVLAKSRTAAPDRDPLIKGGSWVDIPGDEHGGEQKLYNDRFIRRWPSAEKARSAATRYEKLVGQAAVARDAAEAAGTAANIPYNGAEWRYRELARCAAEYAELLGKGLGKDDDLFKAMGASFGLGEHDLEKGGGTKPPAGYSAVPGGAHGGYRKKVGAKWRYWYPDEASASAAMNHHYTEGKAARKRASEHETRAMTMRHASAYSDRDRELAAAKEHEEHSRGAENFIHDTRHAAEKKERDKKVKQAPAGPAAEGKHHIATADGPKEVDTVATHGLYAVHGGGHKDSMDRKGTKNSQFNYTITHTPTGMTVGHERNKSDAIAHAKHFHDHAGDAGKDAKFGTQPAKGDMDRMRAAYEARVKGAAKKAMDDWQPFSGDPAGASEQLQKGFAGLSGPDRMGVREDAFRGVRAPQLRKGVGDSDLRGVGAGFDSRWNDGQGFGHRG